MKRASGEDRSKKRRNKIYDIKDDMCLILLATSCSISHRSFCLSAAIDLRGRKGTLVSSEVTLYSFVITRFPGTQTVALRGPPQKYDGGPRATLQLWDCNDEGGQ